METNQQTVRLVQRNSNPSSHQNSKESMIHNIKQTYEVKPTSEISTPPPRMAFVNSHNTDVGPQATPMFADADEREETQVTMIEPEIPSSDRLQHYLYNQSYQ